MIFCCWSSDVYSVLLGRWTDNKAGKILETFYFNKKYFLDSITSIFWSFNKNYIWLWNNSKTLKLLLVLVLCFFLLNYADMKCSARGQPTVWEIVDPSQMKMTFHFLPKKWCFKKSISNVVSGEVWT